MNFLKGIFLGISIILPGMSGGTAFLILGMYNRILTDLSSFNFKPYITFALGSAAGLLAFAFIVSHLIAEWPQQMFSFLLGALWASAPLILRNSDSFSFTLNKGIYSIGGVLLGTLLTLHPLGSLPLGSAGSQGVLLAGGFISSVAMLIPGVSGSALLILLGIYHDVLQMLKGIQLLQLTMFITGGALGILLLSRVLLTLYHRHKGFFSFFVAGLIIGSGFAVFPSEIDIFSIGAAAAGAFVVSKWGGARKEPPQ